MTYEELALGMTPEEFGLWRNAPAGQLYFGYVERRIDEFRAAAASMIEFGSFDFGPSPPPGRNPHLIGGETRAYRHLAELTLEVIKLHLSGEDEKNHS